MLIPSTAVSADSKRLTSDSYDDICVAHTGVNASGWNATTTFFLPRKSDSLTVPPRWLLNSNSGAAAPGCNAINKVLLRTTQCVDRCYPRYLPDVVVLDHDERELPRVERLARGRDGAPDADRDVYVGGLARIGDDDAGVRDRHPKVGRVAAHPRRQPHDR